MLSDGAVDEAARRRNNAAFVARVQKILGGPGAPTAAQTVSPPPNVAAPAAKRGFPLGIVGALGCVVLILVAALVLRPSVKETPVTPAPAKPIAETKPASVVSDKSIAVLPFANMSDDKENTAFFSDGIQEDILTNLANIAELRVVSRTSVMEYRNTTKKDSADRAGAGRRLHSRGSVRRSGNQVIITGQLIRAANDEHLWAKRLRTGTHPEGNVRHPSRALDRNRWRAQSRHFS